MVLDSLKHAERYTALHPLFDQAFRFLQETDLMVMPTGQHAILGKDLFAIFAEGTGTTEAAAKLEVHQQYIDIQFVIAGTDHMGWKPLALCADPSEPYTSERDAAFFPDKASSWFNVPAGYFTIFYPYDAHAAMATEEHVRKVVLKIAVEPKGER